MEVVSLIANSTEMKRLRTEQTKVDEAIERALEKFVNDKMMQEEKDIFVREKEQ